MATLNVNNVKESVLVGAISLVGIIALLWVFGVTVSFEQFAGLLVVFSAIGWYTRRDADVSVGFVIITAALVMIAVEYAVPNAIVEPFGFINATTKWLVGIDLGAVDPFAFFVIAVVFVALTIAVRHRITGKTKSARPIADQVAREFARFIDTYLSIGRIVILLSAGAILSVFEQAAQLSGVVGNWIAEAPFVAGNLVTGLAGYLSLGGTLPYVGSIPLLDSLTASAFAVFAVLVVFLAAAAEYDGSGPLSQYLKQ